MVLLETLLNDWGIYTPYTVTNFVEKTISNSMDRDKMMFEKLKWNEFQQKSHFFAKSDQVSLEPLEIKTFTFMVEGLMF